MDYLTTNKQAWNVRTRAHLESEFYDVRGFVAGATSLKGIEQGEMGDVAEASLLHLQCHFYRRGELDVPMLFSLRARG